MNPAVEYKNELEPTLRAGQILDGKYRVDYLVGQGGMAAVWAGTNERTGKRVALKVLLPSLVATPGASSLFQREGLTASRVDHPNVVTVFDVVEHQGTACIVMELLSGEGLDRYLARNGPLDLKDAYSLLLPAMRGVSAAHAQGVIHRDLKPQNIFVCVGPDGRPVTTKVLDFGISIIVERVREPVTGQTANVLMGTPAYMAPEQISDFAPIDERTDVYGFGVLFYECLTGRVPFAGDPGPALYEHILYDAVPPLAQARPDLPLGLVRIIETALAKEPIHRHVSLDQMVAALEGEILPATPATGVTMFSMGAPSESGPHAVSTGRRTPVEGVLHPEPSGEHQATRFLVSFPLDSEAGRRSESRGVPRNTPPARGGLPAGLRTPRPATRGEVAEHSEAGEGLPVSYPQDRGLPGGGAWTELARAGVLRRTKNLLRSHRARVWAGVGLSLLVSGSVFAWKYSASNESRAPELLPSLAVQATSGTTGKPELAPAPAPLAVSDPQPTPTLTAGLGSSVTPSVAEPAAGSDVAVAEPRPARRRGSKSAPIRRLDSQSTGGPPLLSPPPAKSRTPAGLPRSRAGNLSAEDF